MHLKESNTADSDYQLEMYLGELEQLVGQDIHGNLLESLHSGEVLLHM